jgi:hypothetical protein
MLLLILLIYSICYQFTGGIVSNERVKAVKSKNKKAVISNRYNSQEK